MSTPTNKSSKKTASPTASARKTKHEQAEMLLDISRHITTFDSLNELLETVVELTSREFDLLLHFVRQPVSWELNVPPSFCMTAKVASCIHTLPRARSNARSE